MRKEGLHFARIGKSGSEENVTGVVKQCHIHPRQWTHPHPEKQIIQAETDHRWCIWQSQLALEYKNSNIFNENCLTWESASSMEIGKRKKFHMTTMSQIWDNPSWVKGGGD
jgi:hypothetical protein